MNGILADNCMLAEGFAISHGILRKIDSTTVGLPCTLLPSPLPSHFMEYAKRIQPAFNLLYHKAALDHDFLENLLMPILPKDSYIYNLWKIYACIRKENIEQEFFLGLNRSDYMLSTGVNPGPNTTEFVNKRLGSTENAVSFIRDNQSCTQWDCLSLRQVEFNLMASSFCGLASRMVQQHRITLTLFGFSEDDLKRVPECNSCEEFADALGEACEHYAAHSRTIVSKQLKPERTVAVLMIVSKSEENVYDQRALLISLLLQHPSIKILIRTFDDLIMQSGKMKLDTDRRLFVDGQEVAVVYFRYGYSPDHFLNDEIWEVKLQLERSLAIKCPCIQYMLVNTKLVQAALSKPEQLARFIDPSNQDFSDILSTFAAQYTLSEAFGISNAQEIDAIVQTCLNRPETYVLKPQREGGGNNYFDDDLVKKLQQIMLDSDSRAAYVIMDRLYPYQVDNYIIGSSKPTKCQKLVSELGIFGTFFAQRNRIIRNKTAGHLLRSKPVHSNEGGIVAGFGCLDSPFLC